MSPWIFVFRAEVRLMMKVSTLEERVISNNVEEGEYYIER
jgi:hypothetical protein